MNTKFPLLVSRKFGSSILKKSGPVKGSSFILDQCLKAVNFAGWPNRLQKLFLDHAGDFKHCPKSANLSLPTVNGARELVSCIVWIKNFHSVNIISAIERFPFDFSDLAGPMNRTGRYGSSFGIIEFHVF